MGNNLWSVLRASLVDRTVPRIVRGPTHKLRREDGAKVRSPSFNTLPHLRACEPWCCLPGS